MTTNTRQYIRDGLLGRLKKSLSELEQIQHKEARGLEKLSKAGPGSRTTGNGLRVPSGGIQNIKNETPEALPGKMDGSMSKNDSLEACKLCGASDLIDHLGDLAGHSHFMCGSCGSAFSHPLAQNREAAANKGSMEKADTYIRPDEIGDKRQVEKGSSDVDLKSRGSSVSDEGSGGKTTRGKKLRKDAPMGFNTKSPTVGSPAMPGMVGPGTTPKPADRAAAGDIHPDTQESLRWLKEQGQTYAPKSKTPPGITGGREVGFKRKPGADELRMDLPGRHNTGELFDSSAGDLAADKKAAGVGFLSNLIAKFRGAGNKTWGDLAGAGPSSATKVARRRGARMAYSEKKMEKDGGIPAAPRAPGAPKLDKDAIPEGDSKRTSNLPSMGGFKSIASSPTAMPNLPGLGRGTKKTSADQANKEIAGFQSIASSPTAMPQMAGIKKGKS